MGVELTLESYLRDDIVIDVCGGCCVGTSWSWN